MRIKVISTHYVDDCPDWVEAERRVEQGLITPDQITSEPASRNPSDIILFGISKRVSAEHSKIFFGTDDTEQYEKQKKEFIKQQLVFLESLLNEVLTSNEASWS